MDVVRGAVERIDDPAEPRGRVVSRLGVGQGLFADEAVLGKGREHDPPDLTLGGEVGLRDVVALPLL